MKMTKPERDQVRAIVRGLLNLIPIPGKPRISYKTNNSGDDGAIGIIGRFSFYKSEMVEFELLLVINRSKEDSGKTEIQIRNVMTTISRGPNSKVYYWDETLGQWSKT